MRTIGAVIATTTFVVLFIGALALRGAPGQPIGATTGPIASQAAQPGEPSVEPDGATPCPSVVVVKNIYTDGPEPTTANLAAVSVVVIVANIASIEPGVWNTPSGSRPAFEAGQPPSAAIIYRPVVITPSNAIRADPISGELRVRALGGQAGCEAAGVHNGRSLDLAEGRAYVFFLGPSLEASGQYGDALTILDAWPIGADGLIETRLEGWVRVERIRSEVEAAPLVLPPLP